LLSLVKVGDVALGVDTARKVARASAEAGATGDKTEEEGVRVDFGGADVKSCFWYGVSAE
jgi:hypothetical protein